MALLPWSVPWKQRPQKHFKVLKYLEIRTGYDPSLLVSRADPLAVTDILGVRGITACPLPKVHQWMLAKPGSSLQSWCYWHGMEWLMSVAQQLIRIRDFITELETCWQKWKLTSVSSELVWKTVLFLVTKWISSRAPPDSCWVLFNMLLHWTNLRIFHSF